MGDELQWMEALLTFNKPKSPVVEEPSIEVPPTEAGRRLTFTVKDWELLQAIITFAESENKTPSNSQLGALLGLGNGAVSARVRRLSEMGLLFVQHFNATDTGINNMRHITVCEVPPRPWSPA